MCLLYHVHVSISVCEHFIELILTRDLNLSYKNSVKAFFSYPASLNALTSIFSCLGVNFPVTHFPVMNVSFSWESTTANVKYNYKNKWFSVPPAFVSPFLIVQKYIKKILINFNKHSNIFFPVDWIQNPQNMQMTLLQMLMFTSNFTLREMQ